MSLLKRRRPTATSEPESTGGADRHVSHDELPSVASMQPSQLDLLALNIARCFCHGWSSGKLAAWEHAFQMADQHLGPVEGSAFVARVIALMRALMRERHGSLRYMSVGCTRICEDEEALMRAIQSAFSEDRTGLKRAVAELTGTLQPETTYTLLAAQALGAFGNRSTLQPQGSERPHQFLN